jgi:hypothetical protein
MQSTLPDYRFSNFHFYTPTGVTGIRLEGQNVVGTWRQRLGRYYGEKDKTVAERFANWGWEPERIAEFTRKYGPLTTGPYQGGDKVFELRFSLDSWTQNQWEFRKLWASIQRGVTQRIQLELGTVEIRKGWLHFGCGSLWDFMTLELLVKSDKMRFCKRSGCERPYFTAQHGKERYCSTDCANWAQSKWKKQWHEAQRQKRLKKGR